MPRPLALGESEVHVWSVDPHTVTDSALLAAYQRLLDDEERSRWARFHFERDRHHYLVAHALVRTVLSRYSESPPSAWRFEKNNHGCPRIAGPEGQTLRFNLSHTKGLVACAVARSRDLGVDVENSERNTETVSVANHFFSPLEVSDMMSLPPEARPGRFFEYWTLKEAYIKAREMGLAIPLDQFGFVLRPNAPVTIWIDPQQSDDAQSWRFFQRRPTSTHYLAVAARGGDELTLVDRIATPLLGELASDPP